MTDKLSRERRSANMRAIRGKHTKPELTVRKILSGFGYRYRLHAKDLPGCPDIVFRSRRKIIFVSGCYWHQHEGCSRATIPQTNANFWVSKLAGNKRRDAAQSAALKASGWRVLAVWECETKNPKRLAARLRRFVGSLTKG